MGNTCCAEGQGNRHARRRSSRKGSVSPIQPKSTPPRLSGMTLKENSIRTPSGVGPFANLFNSYSKAIEDTLVDSVDAADVKGVAKSVVDMVDPRQLALTKLRTEDDARFLQPIWGTYHTDNKLTKESLSTLIEEYLQSLRKFMPQLQSILVRRIVRLFIQGDTKQIEKEVCKALEGGMSRTLDDFINTRKQNLQLITDELWLILDANGDGTVDEAEFHQQFLNSTALVEMGDAFHAAVADEVADTVAKKLCHHLRVPPGRCGLANLGNTCYMNAAIQCLSATPKFRQHFLSDRFIRGVNTSNPLGCKGEIVCAFAKLLKNMWRGQRSFKPTEFKHTVSHHNKMFMGWNQHDSHEFNNYLLDSLHEDLNEVTDKVPYSQLPDEIKQPDSVAAGMWWSNHLQRNRSIIVRLFHGQHKSVLECVKCGSQSIAFDPFSCLSVPFPSSGSPPLKLEACLNLFSKQENIGRECGSCGGNKARKKIMLWRLPKYLIIHMKRFQHTGSKINTPINAPDKLDPSPWLARPLQDALNDMTDCSSSPLPLGPQKPTHRRIPSVGSAASSMDEINYEGTYHLYAKINHFGTARSGHYTATAKIADEWYSFDDSLVTGPLREHPCARPTASAYLLFYALK
eukprot:TRINITY_DN8659_c0_g1_i1.p1 TRINITY_DN8659_c0_g1~~TRINITY_DN8659_c0_g1_i1.p1  ORF type:complete len:628 (+),score=174.51 TRINITY_DN8659_c0_g1_i1:62-1945(+)